MTIEKSFLKANTKYGLREKTTGIVVEVFKKQLLIFIELTVFRCGFL